MNAPFPARLAAVAALGVALALFRCGEEAAPPIDAGVAPKVINPNKPTPEQEKALANELHEAHLEAEEEPSRCRDCHRIEGHAKTDPGHRCLRCHEDQKSAVHVSVANEDARECMTCHEFLEAGIDPWACAGCHTDAENAPVPKIDLPEAPRVEVHKEEACNSCHLPHGDEPVELGECAECHEEITTKHNAEIGDPAQCAECHESHDPAAVAKNSCAECHASDVPKQALFEGHDDCFSCHQTHESRELVTCRSCHEDTKTVGMREIPEHEDCASCHNPHRVTASANGSCVTCHDDMTDVGHPPDEEEGECAGCHPSHPFRGRLVFSKSCVVCHDEAATETSFHAGEACSSCHLTHAFSLADTGDASCAECHLEGAPLKHEARKKSVLVNPIEDHAKCGECHIDANHTPDAKREDCAECHEDQQKTMTTGHEECGECHLPHEGTVEQECKDCHEEKWTSRHETDGQKCDTCHRPHGPEGVAEPQACGECHDEKLPLLHQHEEHQECADCHAFHDRTPQRARSMCLSACHEDMVDHEPAAVSCVGCHPFETDVPEWLKVEDEKK